MRCSNHDVAREMEQSAGPQTARKQTITEHRREQNRRAQRVFRERRRVKKCVSSSRATPKCLAPRPHGDPLLSAVWRPCESEKVLLLGGEITPPSTSHDEALDELQDHQEPASPLIKDAIFTFSSPQTLLPAHESLVPKRRSPTSELRAFMMGSSRPGHALWPHGAPPTLAACLFNGAAMGIDIDRVGDPRYMSPFHQPSFSATSSPTQPAAADTTSNLHLPAPSSLRPCFAQVLFPHHACIDLLPLPKLRETAIMLIVRAQQDGRNTQSSDRDEVQELKKDVYVRQGVRYRGTGELGRDEYVVHDGTARHCGHPWESGSWAVAPWFATKWKYLMDV